MQQMNKPYPGLFITVEGGEGCGKTTLCQRLFSFLSERGYQVIHTREPGGTPLSESLRDLLLKNPTHVNISPQSELLLFLAARAQHIEEGILPALREGKVVICERFNDSTIAYQGCARHLGMGYVEQLCHLASRSLEPDCTLFLDLDPEIGLTRAKKQRGEQFDRLEQEHLQFHREVRQGFLHLADQHSRRIHIIDAALSLDEVFEASQKALDIHLLLRPSKGR